MNNSRKYYIQIVTQNNVVLDILCRNSIALHSFKSIWIFGNPIFPFCFAFYKLHSFFTATERKEKETQLSRNITTRVEYTTCTRQKYRRPRSRTPKRIKCFSFGWFFYVEEKGKVKLN